jgi:hypothetical protein
VKMKQSPDLKNRQKEDKEEKKMNLETPPT